MTLGSASGISLRMYEPANNPFSNEEGYLAELIITSID